MLYCNIIQTIYISVSITSHNETNNTSGQIQMASVLSDSRITIGRFSQVTNNNSVPSNQSFNPIKLTSSADVNSTGYIVNNVYWMSPEVASGCITFV